MQVLKFWKIAEFLKISIKRKIAKNFMRPKQWAALRKLLSLPQPDKIFLQRYTEIYRYFLSKCFKNAVLGRQEIVQCKYLFFLTSHRNMFAGKSVKWERLLAVFHEHVIFNVNWIEVCKLSEIFWAKLYCKMGDLFH